MLVDRIEVKPGAAQPGRWPWTVPAVRAIAENGLELTSDIVVLVGANGSGKSTLLEAVAEAYGLDVRGGHGGRRYASALEKGPLGEALHLQQVWGTVISRRGRSPRVSFSARNRRWGCSRT
ncbi:hypothetical protein D5S17_05545 [Pseudonocardiaceae bacterium YIM PH 21723]|nr:hypothetical protein D5S17_05545 [Pseudonocardiaceae bacterium YIM PH 21723]